MERKGTLLIGDIGGNKINIRSFDELLRYLFMLFCIRRRIKLDFTTCSSTNLKGYYITPADSAKEIINHFFINTSFLEVTLDNGIEVDTEIKKYYDFCYALRSLPIESFMDLYPRLFDGLCESYYKKDIGTIGLLNSEAITKLVCSLLKENGCKSIYNPFAGLCPYSIGMEDDVLYRGQEKNFELFQIAQLRLDAYGKTNSIVYNEDVTSRLDGNFDAIVTTPPFGLKVQVLENGAVRNVNSEMIAIDRFLEPTNDSRLLVTVVPVSFLYSETGNVAGMRTRLTRLNMLDCVIQLPGGIFQSTSIASAIVVLKKHRKNGQMVKFVDASSYYTKDGSRNVLTVDGIEHLLKESCLEVSTDEILSLNSSWNVQWYWNRMRAVYCEGYTVVRLADILEPVRTTRRFPETKGHLVTIGTLSSDSFSYEKRPEDFPEKDIVNNVVKLTEPAFLISKIGEPRPTFCKASEETPVFIKGDIYLFTISNKTIHEGYLCMELAKRLIPTSGTLYPMLLRTQLLETLVEFPSLNGDRSWVEQKNIFEEARLAAGIGKEREEWLEALIEKKKREYIEEVRHRKHDMKTPMSQLRNTLTLLESLVPQISGEPAEKLMLYVQRQKRAMDRLSEIVTHIADEDVFATPEPVDLGEVLSSFQTKTDRYIIQYFPDKALFDDSGLAKPMVNMGRSDLLRLVQNIIENAIRHGFVGKNSEYALNISLTIREGFYVVDFSNNGKPLPEGLDKARYGMKGERGKDSDGSGTGGYIVKSITEHYGGDYDVFSEQFAGIWFTHVIVKLPIYQDNE